MRVLLLSCLLGLGLAAPQGYFYQTQIGGGGVEGQSHISLEQYQIQRQQEQNQLEQQKLQLLHQQQIELQQQLQQQVQQQFQQQHYQQQQQVHQQQQQVQQQQQQLQQQVEQQQLQQQVEQQQLQQQVEQQQLQQQVEQQQLQQQFLVQQQGLPLQQQQQQQAFVVIGNPADLGQLVQFEQEQQLQQQQPESQQQAFVGGVATRLGYETAVPEAQTQQQVFEVAAPTGQLEQNSQASLQQVVEQPPTSSLLSLSSSSSSSTSSSTPAQTIERPQTLPQVAHLQTSSSSSVATTSYQPAQTLHYHKEFYFLAAPQEDPSELEQSVQKQLGQMKKNLRVVFIKAPENNGLTKAALQLAQQSLDSQTAIYVLTKQHDVADLAAKLQQLRDSTGSSRPDVTFVKYRTPQEAEHAQRTIQAQFEALNGPNSFNYEGVAPTHNFVGSTDGSTGAIDLRSASASKPAPSAVVAPASSKATDNSPAAQPSEEAKSPGAHYLPAAKH